MLKALALTGVLVLTGSAGTATCADTAQAPPATSEVARDDIVHATGHNGVRFGSSRSQVAGYIDQDRPGCNSQLRDRPEGSLVFTPDDKLVLMWFNAPLKTPEGIATGATIGEVQKAYPSAATLAAPKNSYRFDGLLVSYGEHGYLFLHDGKTVRKAVAGYVVYLQRLIDTGSGAC